MPGCLFDTSVWLAAVFASHPFHEAAQTSLQKATPAEPAVFCRSTQQSFLRLSSTPAILKAYGVTGVSNDDALAMLRALLALPQVLEREEPPGTPALWHRLASHHLPSPKIWMDAYLAAFAISGGLRLASLDQDFKKYAANGLKLDLSIGATRA